MIVRFFGAEHCPQCKSLRPRVEEWCKENGAKFMYLDAEEEDNIASLAEHGIRSVPSLIVIGAANNVWFIEGIDGWNKFIGGNKK